MSDVHWVFYALVVVLSTARITRLLTFDAFPPIKTLRDAFANWTDKTDRRRAWQLLAFCGYCMSFWVAAGVVLTSLWAGVVETDACRLGEGTVPAQIWWIVTGIFAASYPAAIIMAFDGDDSESD